ncbi:hypothetical protein ABI59_09830 [Acidobacteria bacterium Mor1]|nr:hypothetical protein ABI59_09830 [Acidobacteria bacterium Mor1]
MLRVLLEDIYSQQAVERALEFRYAVDTGSYATSFATLREILSLRDSEPVEELVARLVELGDRAQELGYPMFRMRTRTIAAYMLRQQGSPTALVQARALLEEQPEWFESPSALIWSGALSYERASLALEENELRTAWHHYKEAERAFGPVADQRMLLVALKQAQLLWRIGAEGEARSHLAETLEQCRESDCNMGHRAAAQSTLAWYALSDPYLGDGKLEAVEAGLKEALAGEAESDDLLERANTQVNLAYLEWIRGADSSLALEEARGILSSSADLSNSSRGREITDWIELVEASRLLGQGRVRDAAVICESVVSRTDRTAAAIFATDCRARAALANGNLGEAAALAADAVELQEREGVGKLGQQVPAVPGRHSDRYLLAASIAVERGDAEAAWDYLAALDQSTQAKSPSTEPEEQAQRRKHLLAQLERLGRPTKTADRYRKAVEQRLRAQLRELDRTSTSGFATLGRDIDFRIAPLQSEIVMLRRHRGTVQIYRRTKMKRRAVAAVADAVTQRLDPGHVADTAVPWGDLVGPLSAAVVPEASDMGARTIFAVHGRLQEIPLDALPLGDGVLSDHTAVVYRPAGAGSDRLPPANPRRMFVVDPEGNLASGRRMAQYYRQRYEEASVLHREDARAQAVLDRLPEVDWLHLDTHAAYDPAFAELSALKFYDRDVFAEAIRDLPDSMYLANLSGCRTGRNPPTADSGRYGIAGVLARKGTPWVVASRADLDDAVAERFNRSFYAYLEDGRTVDVPEAFRLALSDVRRSHPVERWAALMLLGAEQGAGNAGRARAATR